MKLSVTQPPSIVALSAKPRAIGSERGLLMKTRLRRVKILADLFTHKNMKLKLLKELNPQYYADMVEASKLWFTYQYDTPEQFRWCLHNDPEQRIEKYEQFIEWNEYTIW